MQTRILLAVIALTAGSAASAEEWRWSVTPYLWASDVGIDVAIHDRPVVDSTIPFEDLLEDLDSAALVRFEAMRGAHGMALDLFDVVLRDGSGRVPLPGGPGDELSLKAEIGMTFLDLTGVYDPEGDGRGLALLYGARILNQRENLTVGIYEGDDALAGDHIEADDTYVDGLLGLRYAGSLAGRWEYELVADASTGGTEFTWSVAPAIGFRFGSREQYRLTAGYRHLAMDLPSGQAADLDMTLSGYLIGFRFAF